MNTSGDNNRSVRETKARIKAVFLDSMKTKHYTKISVSEITKAANINRTTFYLHYQDIYDLLDKIEEDVAEQVGATIDKINREGYVPGEHPQHIAVFEVLNENVETCRVLMSSNGDINFLHKLTDSIREAFFNAWCRLCMKDPPEELSTFVSYIAFGIVGLFLEAIESEDGIDADKMGFIAGEITNWIDENFVRHKPNG